MGTSKLLDELLEKGDVKSITELLLECEKDLLNETIMYQKSKKKAMISFYKRKLLELNKIEILDNYNPRINDTYDISNHKIFESVVSNNNLTIDSNFVQNQEHYKSNSITIKSLNDKTFHQIFESDGPIYINSCTNCTFNLIAQQVRIYSCSNLNLNLFTKTGVFIEKSAKIEIKPLKIDSDEKNNYANIKYFDDPIFENN